MRSLIKVVAITIVTLVVASQFFPDIVRIPDRWRPHLPRVEFVRHDAEVSPPPPPIAAAVAVPVPAPAPRPDTIVAPPPPPVAAVPEKPKHKAVKRARPKVQEIPEEDSNYGTEPTAMIVPVRVTTEIELSDTSRIPTPAAPEVKSGEDWPLVCGDVVDGSGAGVEGAQITIESTDLGERTDPKGRFCLACPARKVTLLVAAPGRDSVRYAVELEGHTTQVHVTVR